MEQKNSQTFKIDKKYHKDILDFIKLNEIQDVNMFIDKCFKKGFDIQRFGLLGNETEIREVEKIVEKIIEVPIEKVVEIIKEVPTPPVEIEVIKYVDKEVIKEVPIEKIVEKIEYIYDKPQTQIIEKEIIKEIIKEVPIEKIIEIEKPNEKVKMLENTLLSLKKELQLKQNKINELENKIKNLEEIISSNVKGFFMKGSNLNEKL